MPNLTAYPSAKQAAADAGLTPSEYNSGSSIHRQPHLSKSGNARLRKLLHFPALIKQLRAWLLERGKAKMVIVGAAMRKLLHLAYGILKHQLPFDPNWV